MNIPTSINLAHQEGLSTNKPASIRLAQQEGLSNSLPASITLAHQEGGLLVYRPVSRWPTKEVSIFKEVETFRRVASARWYGRTRCKQA